MSSTPADQPPTSADQPSTAAEQSASEAPPTRAGAGIRFAAVGLDHSHIYGQISGLLGQGCQLVGISSDDPDASVATEVRSRWPDAPWFDDPEQLFKDERIDLIVTAAVPDRRAPIAVGAMRNGKDVVCGQARLRIVRSAGAGQQCRGRDGSVLVSHLLRALRGPLRGACGRTRSRRPNRPGGADAGAGPAPRRRPRPSGRRRRPPGLVLRPYRSAGTHRHGQSSDRPVPVVHRLDDRRGGGKHGGQLHPSRPSQDAGLRGGAAAQRVRPGLHPRRLVHPTGSADLGRRSASSCSAPRVIWRCGSTSTCRDVRAATTSSWSIRKEPTTSTAPTFR